MRTAASAGFIIKGPPRTAITLHGPAAAIPRKLFWVTVRKPLPLS